MVGRVNAANVPKDEWLENLRQAIDTENGAPFVFHNLGVGAELALIGERDADFCYLRRPLVQRLESSSRYLGNLA